MLLFFRCFSARGGSQPKADQPLAGAKTLGGLEFFNKMNLVLLTYNRKNLIWAN